MFYCLQDDVSGYIECENEIKARWLLGESCLHILVIWKLVDGVSGIIEHFVAKILFKSVTLY